MPLSRIQLDKLRQIVAKEGFEYAWTSYIGPEGLHEDYGIDDPALTRLMVAYLHAGALLARYIGDTTDAKAFAMAERNWLNWQRGGKRARRPPTRRR